MNKKDPGYASYTRLESPQYFYNKQGTSLHPKIVSFDNIHIVRVLKNAQTSLLQICRNTLHLQDHDVSSFEPKEKNTFILIVREPKYRFISFVNMMHGNLRRSGLFINWKDFQLGKGHDLHLMKQIFYIPMNSETKQELKNTISPITIRNLTHNNRWGDYVNAKDLIKVLDNSKDEYKFFRMTSENNPVKDIGEFLGERGVIEPDVVRKAGNIRANVSKPYVQLPREPAFEKVMHKYYQQDIDFYNQIRCEND